MPSNIRVFDCHPQSTEPSLRNDTCFALANVTTGVCSDLTEKERRNAAQEQCPLGQVQYPLAQGNSRRTT